MSNIFRTPIAEQMWDMKYRLKDYDGTPIDLTVHDTWTRVAKHLASCEKDPVEWEKAFYEALESFKFIPAGRINAGAGTGSRNVTLFNCFSGDTRITTKEFGVVDIEAVAGKKVHVMDGNGNWILAPINIFGKRGVSRVYLQGGYNNRQRYEVSATDNHRWILEDGSEKVTKDLQEGDTLVWVDMKPIPYSADYKAGVQHGLIYGDGTKSYKNKYTIRLCGAKLELAGWLEDWKVTYPPSSFGEPHFFGTNGRPMKDLPDTSMETIDYLKGFLRGWMATDGHVCKRDQKAIISCGPTGRAWLEKFGPIVGFEVAHSTELPKETNYGERKVPMFNCALNNYLLTRDDFLRTVHKKNFKERSMTWSVKEVIDDYEEATVYCPRVTTTDSVQLLSGVHSGQCFVMGTVEDSLSGIYDGLKEAVLTMQQGGGIGYDFSTLRPQGAEVKGVASDSSGPLSFMDVWDASCRTIMSAGTRRGAMMATMRCDHPDIEKFIEAKRDPLRLRMFNMSVLVTDAFMVAVKNNEKFDLKFNGKIYKTINAKSLWDKIMSSTYHYAEPGVIFIDRINAMNNLNYCETIAATNPCVSGDTPILTRKGYLIAEELAGSTVEVWNGAEWSEVKVKVTGENQQTLDVELSDGSYLTCTPYHRFHLSNGTIKEAKDLSVGDKLIKHDWPICEPNSDIEDVYSDVEEAYEMGFFSGDGWVKGDNKCYVGLYGDKKKLLPLFTSYQSVNEYSVTGGYEGTDTTQTKLYLYFGKRNWSKSFVPKDNWSVEAKKSWLRGLMDSDGSVTKDGNAQITAKDRDFLRWVKLLLNEVGASGTLSSMKDCWRLTIPASYYHKLNLNCRHGSVKPSREATRFVKISSVTKGDVEEKVYCFTEPKRGTGIFNGVITGQCGEQPLPPYGACLLGSINMVAMLTDDYKINYRSLETTIKLAVRMMDNVVDVSKFPLKEQEKEAKDKRRIGLGVTGLADALALGNLVYGSDEAVAETGKIMKFIAVAAYQASIDLAKEKGAFPLFDADKYLATDNMKGMPKNIRDQVREHGIRNALLTSIAPTGTISLYAGNVSSGIEPIFALSYERKVMQKDGSKITEVVEDYGVTKWKRDNVGVKLPASFVTAQTLEPSAHVRMQAAAQRWIDSSISKTINVPEDINFDDFKQVYMDAYDTGCKGCTTYRPNDVTGSVLTATEEGQVEEGGACEIKYDENTGQLIRTCE